MRPQSINCGNDTALGFHCGDAVVDCFNEAAVYQLRKSPGCLTLRSLQEAAETAEIPEWSCGRLAHASMRPQSINCGNPSVSDGSYEVLAPPLQ